MKKLMTLILAAGMCFAAAAPASAIDFNVEGEWLMGFGVGNPDLLNRVNGKKADNNDKFSALQRIRLQLEAKANENLSGTVRFEIGDSNWGKNGDDNGGALGADGKIVGLLNAYIDWAVPDTELKVRMGLQPFGLPNAAGGSSILDTDAVAGVVASYQFTENVGATLFWMRPYNDNYETTEDGSSRDQDNYLDNVDLIGLTVPLTFDGIEVTPWIMLGIIGDNAYRGEFGENDSNITEMTSGYANASRWNVVSDFERNSDANHMAFWGGLPVVLSLWDPINVEFEFDYGYVSSLGRGTLEKNDGTTKRFDTKSEGWLAKALVEYKMDWGTPGIFGWYGSGDDSNPKNGSERLPSIEAKGNFTSFMGDGNMGWGPDGCYDRTLSYAGTWGIGLQVADMSFIEDLSHTFRVAYWGGTNSKSMAKYAASPYSWNDTTNYSGEDTLYMTTEDGLLEFNLVNSYQMYENFEINLELGYMVNFFDHDTWEDAGDDQYKKRDAWKAHVTFAYTF